MRLSEGLIPSRALILCTYHVVFNIIIGILTYGKTRYREHEWGCSCIVYTSLWYPLTNTTYLTGYSRRNDSTASSRHDCMNPCQYVHDRANKTRNPRPAELRVVSDCSHVCIPEKATIWVAQIHNTDIGTLANCIRTWFHRFRSLRRTNTIQLQTVLSLTMRPTCTPKHQENEDKLILMQNCRTCTDVHATTYFASCSKQLFCSAIRRRMSCSKQLFSSAIRRRIAVRL